MQMPQSNSSRIHSEHLKKTRKNAGRVEKRKCIVLASEPGVFRNSLQNMLGTYPDVDVLVLTSSLRGTLTAVKKYTPALVVLDANLIKHEPAPAELLIRIEIDNTRLLLLVNDAEQAAQFQSTHSVMMKGTRPELLSQRIESLLAIPYP